MQFFEKPKSVYIYIINIMFYWRIQNSVELLIAFCPLEIKYGFNSSNTDSNITSSPLIKQLKGNCGNEI